MVDLVELFGGKVVDIGQTHMMIELTGPEQKIDAFIDLCRPYGITKPWPATGIIAMPRGKQGDEEGITCASTRNSAIIHVFTRTVRAMSSYSEPRMAKNVVVVGATGAVGQQFVQILEQRNFPTKRVRFLASARSAGKSITFRGKQYPRRGTDREEL